MIVTVQNNGNTKGFKTLALYNFVAALIVWFVIRKFTNGYIPEKYCFVCTTVLIGLTILLYIIGIVNGYLRGRSMSIGEAKKYLIAFAEQYDTSINTDIANCVTAIRTLQYANLLHIESEDTKRIGTVHTDCDITNNYTVIGTTEQNNGINQKEVTIIEKTNDEENIGNSVAMRKNRKTIQATRKSK